MWECICNLATSANSQQQANLRNTGSKALAKKTDTTPYPYTHCPGLLRLPPLLTALREAPDDQPLPPGQVISSLFPIHFICPQPVGYIDSLFGYCHSAATRKEPYSKILKETLFL